MTENSGDKKPATNLVTAGRRKEWTGALVNPPVSRASTILYDSVVDLNAGKKSNEDGKFFYGRRGTPSQWALAEALTEMEPGAHGTMLYPSGVAALSSALLAVLKPGDVLLMVDSVYDPTRSYADTLLKQMQIETRYYDPLVGADIEALICERTKAILMESPGSLTFEVQDVPAICAVAQQHGITTLLDNTWGASYFFRALEHGVDINIIAGTKYIVGHSDVMLGSVTANKAHWPRVRRTAQRLGQHVSADDAYLALRGLRTLDVRMRQHQESALKIAQWLQQQSQVVSVLHPALPECPGHALWERDFSGAAGLFSFELREGDDDAVGALIDDLGLFGIGYSWGGYESLAIPVYPERDRTATEWKGHGPLVRLSIGLEDTGDLIADLAKGLQRYDKAICKK